MRWREPRFRSLPLLSSVPAKNLSVLETSAPSTRRARCFACGGSCTTRFPRKRGTRERGAPAARRAAIWRGARRAIQGGRSTAARELEAVALGGQDLPPRRRAAERLRDLAEVHRQRAA